MGPLDSNFDLTNPTDLNMICKMQAEGFEIRSTLARTIHQEVRDSYANNQKLRDRVENILYGTSLFQIGVDLQDPEQFALIDQLKEKILSEFGEKFVAPAIYGFIGTYARS